MAMIAQSDFSNDQEQSYGVIPPGRYTVDVTGDDYKATRAGTGAYAEYVLTIADGQHTGRKLWATFNLENPNPKAVEIGRSQFKAFAKAAGHPNPNMIRDTAEMAGKRLIVSVIVTGTEEEQNQRNEVKGYFPNGHLLGQPGMNGAPTYQPAASAPVAPQPPVAPQAPIVAQPTVAPPAPAAPSVAPAPAPTTPAAPPAPVQPAPIGVAPAAAPSGEVDPFAVPSGVDPFAGAVPTF